MRTNYAAGIGAESLCRLALRLKGYRIIASRYRSPLGEIDIVAARGRCLALVEVKARATYQQAAEAVSPRQQERLVQAANDFLARHPRFTNHTTRFDVMLVTPWRWPKHLLAAWNAN